MAKITQTLNPLHFEDLEPHRFEDLARQLVYDFRDWSNLEATGTKGSDDGFDVRGREPVILRDSSTDGSDDVSDSEERIWLIQCKREKSISPKDIDGYLDAIFSKSQEKIHGIIFIAACNYSKKTRDVFIMKIREKGVKEFQLWGKAELEDLLFQPKNDHLLFAYFGISLAIRHRTMKTMLRSRIATKKKALNAIEESIGVRGVLIRDANDTHYPYDGDVPNFNKCPPWKIFNFEKQTHDGLEFLLRKRMAYVSDDKIHFDYIPDYDVVENWNDPWRREENRDADIVRKWRELPDSNRAFIEIYGVIKYDNILAIDEDGDDHFEGPHFYVTYNQKDGPFGPLATAKLTNCVIGEDRVSIYPDINNRITFFQKHTKSRKKIISASDRQKRNSN